MCTVPVCDLARPFLPPKRRSMNVLALRSCLYSTSSDFFLWRCCVVGGGGGGGADSSSDRVGGGRRAGDRVTNVSEAPRLYNMSLKEGASRRPVAVAAAHAPW